MLFSQLFPTRNAVRTSFTLNVEVSLHCPLRLSHTLQLCDRHSGEQSPRQCCAADEWRLGGVGHRTLGRRTTPARLLPGTAGDTAGEALVRGVAAEAGTRPAPNEAWLLICHRCQ